MTYQYAFIGAGNMAKAMIAGLINQGVSNQRIIASTKTKTSGQALSEQLNIEVVQDNAQCLDAEIIILAVKPQILNTVLAELPTEKLKGKLLISVIAGIPSRAYYRQLGEHIKLIRLMPNTPSLIGHGMTGAFLGPNCSESDKEQAQRLLDGIGKTLWVDEERGIDYVNAISGSGPAYFYYFIKAIADKGEQLGLSYSDAVNLAMQTALGTSQLCINQSDGTPEFLQALIDQVTSKGGTTIEAINTFEAHNLSDIVDKGIQACFDRAIAIGETYSNEE